LQAFVFIMSFLFGSVTPPPPPPPAMMESVLANAFGCALGTMIGSAFVLFFLVPDALRALAFFETQYVKELKKAKALVKELVKEKSCAPILVRLAWHDSGTYDNRETKSWPEMGGAIGSIRTTHEITAGPNAGLKTALDGLLAPIKKVCPSLSWADLIQLASATAIEVSGGP
jgi:hypothetical protein